MTQFKCSGGDALARAVEKIYENNGGSEYGFEPMNLYENGEAVGLVRPGDGVIFCCRRGERETELTDAFTDPNFRGFERKMLDPLDFVILTMYSEKYTYLPIAFAPSKVQKTLAEVLSAHGKTQLHLAESEKFAHVTFFFNGGNQRPFDGEDDIRIPSRRAFRSIPFRSSSCRRLRRRCATALTRAMISSSRTLQTATSSDIRPATPQSRSPAKRSANTSARSFRTRANTAIPFW